MPDINIIPSVNFHITKACNMKCKYCFAKFKQLHSDLNLILQKDIIKRLYEAGFTKINFVGGEPLLVPDLKHLIKYAKKLDFYVSVVTNGTYLNYDFLSETGQYLDLIGLSVDSLIESVNNKIGRTFNGITPNKNYYMNLCEKINQYNIDLKINTVVSQFNKNENFTNFISYVNPLRWKIFQVLSVKGENNITGMEISKNEFDRFIENHKDVKTYIVAEDNELLQGSYIMINPMGRFFDNLKGAYTISDSIIKVGVSQALNQINFDIGKYIKRDGNYYELITLKTMAS